MNSTTSAVCEPPKPRLITGRSGKLSAVRHMRMLELPTNSTASRGHAFLASHASKAAMSFSHCDFRAASSSACGRATPAQAQIANNIMPSHARFPFITHPFYTMMPPDPVISVYQKAAVRASFGPGLLAVGPPER